MIGAIWTEGRFVVADDLEVRDPGPDEVIVRVLASGICHSEIVAMGMEWDRPVVLGHEAAGVVERCGDDVTSLAIGDPVTVHCQKPCGDCRECRRSRFTLCPTVFGIGLTPFTWRGQAVLSTARVSSFSSRIVVHEQQALRCRGLEPQAAALIGCAVSTGYGNVRNVAHVVEGDTVAVIGVGGIGVNALQTARLQGARQVIAVDIQSEKREAATFYGADRFVTAVRDEGAGELAARIRDAAEAPIDAVIECSGAPVAIEAAAQAVGAGGHVAIVGLQPDGTMASYDVNAMMWEGKTIAGAFNGACNPFVDLPEIVRLAEAGSLEIASQVSHVWPLAEIDDAVDALRRGDVVRAVLDLS